MIIFSHMAGQRENAGGTFSTLIKHSSFNTCHHLKHHHSLFHVYQNTESIEMVEEVFFTIN